MDAQTYLERSKNFWIAAASYSPDKESVYLQHSIAQQFDLHAGKYVLEYGAGGGSDAMSFLRRGCRVDYCDIVSGNIRASGERIKAAGLEAKARGYALPDSAPLPFDSSTFDVISSHGVLHHLIDPSPVMAEFFRVLRPGGHFMCMLYGPELWKAGCKNAGVDVLTPEQFGSFTDGCPYSRYYTEDEGRAFVSAHGFDVQSVYFYNDDYFMTLRCVKPIPDPKPAPAHPLRIRK